MGVMDEEYLSDGEGYEIPVQPEPSMDTVVPPPPRWGTEEWRISKGQPMLTNIPEYKGGKNVLFADEYEGKLTRYDDEGKASDVGIIPVTKKPPGPKPSVDEMNYMDFMRTSLNDPDIQKEIELYVASARADYEKAIPYSTRALMKEGEFEKGLSALTLRAKDEKTKELKGYLEETYKAGQKQEQLKDPTDMGLTIQALTDKLGRKPTAQEIIDYRAALKSNEEISRQKAIQAEKDSSMDIKGLAEGVINGHDAPMAIKGSMGNPVSTKVKSAVQEKYPNFDFMMADANYKWKQSATNQRTINFVGGALPRLGALDEQLKAMPNVDINAINAGMRLVLTQLGKTPYTNYESNRNAIVQEVNTALSGSSQGSDMRIKIELENLQSARSPAQISGAIDNLRMALEARLDVDLSPLYPIEVVRGDKTIDQYKKELYARYRGDFNPHFGQETERNVKAPPDKYN